MYIYYHVSFFCITCDDVKIEEISALLYMCVINRFLLRLCRCDDQHFASFLFFFSFSRFIFRWYFFFFVCVYEKNVSFLSFRTCNGMVLPCSPGDLERCVSTEQAKELFDSGDWSFHHKYTFKVQKTVHTARVLKGILLSSGGKVTVRLKVKRRPGLYGSVRLRGDWSLHRKCKWWYTFKVQKIVHPARVLYLLMLLS